VDFTMADIDRLSRRVPVLSKVAPAKNDVHMEDVHRAGGIMAILGELDRAGLLHTDTPTVHSRTMADALAQWDVARTNAPSVQEFYRAAPGGVPTQTAFSQNRRWSELDLDRENGVIRSAEHAFSQDGGLAVLAGNLAADGCIVKTAGVDESILKFTGPAKVYESQDAAVTAILTGQVVEGDVVLIRYEGPKGGPGMQEMLYPTSYLKSKGLGKACALVTDGRFSGAARACRSATSRPRRPRAATLPGRDRRPDRHRHSRPHHRRAGRARGTRPPSCRDGSQGRRCLAAGQAARAQGFRGASGLCRDDHQRGARRRARSGAVEAGLMRRAGVLGLLLALSACGQGAGSAPEPPMVTIDCATDGAAPCSRLPGRACARRRAAPAGGASPRRRFSPLAESG
jgi:hypothetical protein